eukprot:TRINITY_DN12545_c0_g1_i2.p1 TRINITY_DN12545_c0_g1~~TRINITY_DN12545_c0_g1_i2.p1  ORF type:complete len:907 (-),score=167.33 TRINITY_DN12545_c0_g1_i2:193-2913(-)
MSSQPELQASQRSTEPLPAGGFVSGEAVTQQPQLSVSSQPVQPASNGITEFLPTLQSRTTPASYISTAAAPKQPQMVMSPQPVLLASNGSTGTAAEALTSLQSSSTPAWSLAGGGVSGGGLHTFRQQLQPPAVQQSESMVQTLAPNSQHQQALTGMTHSEAHQGAVTSIKVMPAQRVGDVLRLGQLAVEAEAIQEDSVCRQLQDIRFPAAVPMAPAVELLPGGGALDALLEGSAEELLEELLDQFKADPSPDWGRCPSMIGKFHSMHSIYGRHVFSAKAVHSMFLRAQREWQNEPNVLRLTLEEEGTFVVVGDTHGQLEDFLWILSNHGLPSKRNKYLVIGDIVDRGGHALEIFLVLLALRRDYPGCVHILRGNHEDATIAVTYGFKAELESKYGPSGHGAILFHYLTHEALPLLPLAAIISDVGKTWSAFAVHGGIPDGSVTIDEMERLPRAAPSTSLSQTRGTPEDVLLFNLLWSDPVEGSRPPGTNIASNGRGQPFMEQDTVEFCLRENVAYILRAHQMPADLRGVRMQHANRCLTIFSASNYGGACNQGGILKLRPSTTPGFPSLEVSEFMAPPWPTLSEQLRGTFVEAATPVPSPVHAAKSTGLLQWEYYIIEQICLKKRSLLVAFMHADTDDLGTVTHSEWMSIMANTLGIELGWKDLASKWDIGSTVEYVSFLHGFQVESALSTKSCNATHVNLYTAMSQLRVSLSDVCCANLMCGLDANMNGHVSLDEFSDFLSRNMADISVSQTAALYEALLVALKRSIGVEDVCMAIALIGTSSTAIAADTSVDEAQAWKTARKIGSELRRQGRMFGIFQSWDLNGDGYLSLEELRASVKRDLPGIGADLSEEEFRSLMNYIDSQGNAEVNPELLRPLEQRREPRAVPGSSARDEQASFSHGRGRP